MTYKFTSNFTRDTEGCGLVIIHYRHRWSIKPEVYSRFESVDDSTDRTEFGSSAAASNSSRAVAGDRTDGGRSIDTTAGCIWDGDGGFSRLFAAAFNTRDDGGGGGVLCRRWAYTIVCARAGGHDGTSFWCGCAGTACSDRIVVAVTCVYEMVLPIICVLNVATAKRAKKTVKCGEKDSPSPVKTTRLFVYGSNYYFFLII